MVGSGVLLELLDFDVEGFGFGGFAFREFDFEDSVFEACADGVGFDFAAGLPVADEFAGEGSIGWGFGFEEEGVVLMFEVDFVFGEAGEVDLDQPCVFGFVNGFAKSRGDGGGGLGCLLEQAIELSGPGEGVGGA